MTTSLTGQAIQHQPVAEHDDGLNPFCVDLHRGDDGLLTPQELQVFPAVYHHEDKERGPDQIGQEGYKPGRAVGKHHHGGHHPHMELLVDRHGGAEVHCPGHGEHRGVLCPDQTDVQDVAREDLQANADRNDCYKSASCPFLDRAASNRQTLPHGWCRFQAAARILSSMPLKSPPFSATNLSCMGRTALMKLLWFGRVTRMPFSPRNLRMSSVSDSTVAIWC